MKNKSKTLSQMTNEAETIWAKIAEAKGKIKTSRREYSRLINRGNSAEAEKYLLSIRENITACEQCFSELDELRSGLSVIESGQGNIISVARAKLVESQNDLRVAQQNAQAAESAVEVARNAGTPLMFLRERLQIKDSDRNLDNLE